MVADTTVADTEDSLRDVLKDITDDCQKGCSICLDIVDDQIENRAGDTINISCIVIYSSPVYHGNGFCDGTFAYVIDIPFLTNNHLVSRSLPRDGREHPSLASLLEDDTFRRRCWDSSKVAARLFKSCGIRLGRTLDIQLVELARRGESLEKELDEHTLADYEDYIEQELRPFCSYPALRRYEPLDPDDYYENHDDDEEDEEDDETGERAITHYSTVKWCIEDLEVMPFLLEEDLSKCPSKNIPVPEELDRQVQKATMKRIAAAIAKAEEEQKDGPSSMG